MSDHQRRDVLAEPGGKPGEHQVFGAFVQQGGTTLVPVAQLREAGVVGGNGRAVWFHVRPGPGR